MDRAKDLIMAHLFKMYFDGHEWDDILAGMDQAGKEIRYNLNKQAFNKMGHDYEVEE